MIGETQKQKIIRFLNDEVMADAVKQAVIYSFLKSRPEKEVHYLAAKSLSVEFLEEAWKDLNKYRSEDQKGTKTINQVGL